jgi:CheY-like chemotaxis protein
MMRPMDGAEVYRALVAHRPNLAARIVFMTGGLVEPETQAFIRSLPNPCIEKPFDVRSLEQLLQRVIRAAGEDDSYGEARPSRSSSAEATLEANGRSR